jgi:cephalosporin hydroxylase
MTVEQILAVQAGRAIVEGFNDLWYRSDVGGELTWRGDPIVKNPCDLWMMIELFQRLRPTAIVETGTYRGGSASFWADMLRVLEIPASVVTIDVHPQWSFAPESKGILSIVGPSTDPSVVGQVQSAIADAKARREGPILVTLDSDHTQGHVAREMTLYSGLVTVGSYLVVEDTNVNGHPSRPDAGPGPWEAVTEFLAQRSDFVADRDCERYLLTYCPRGWLRRVRE